MTDIGKIKISHNNSGFDDVRVASCSLFACGFLLVSFQLFCSFQICREEKQFGVSFRLEWIQSIDCQWIFTSPCQGMRVNNTLQRWDSLAQPSLMFITDKAIFHQELNEVLTKGIWSQYLRRIRSWGHITPWLAAWCEWVLLNLLPLNEPQKCCSLCLSLAQANHITLLLLFSKKQYTN